MKREHVYLTFQNNDHYQRAFRHFPAAIKFLNDNFPGYFENGYGYTGDEIAGVWQWDHPTHPTFVKIIREPLR